MSTGAFDVSRRSFLSLLGATGATVLLPDSAKAILSEYEPIPKQQKVQPALGAWLKRTNGQVTYIGKVKSLVQHNLVDTQEGVEVNSQFIVVDKPKGSITVNDAEIHRFGT